MATKGQTKSTKKLRFGVGLHYDVLGDAPAGDGRVCGLPGR